MEMGRSTTSPPYLVLLGMITLHRGEMLKKIVMDANVRREMFQCCDHFCSCFNNLFYMYFRPSVNTLFGPLEMTPSSIDNYGVDFCGMLVLPSWPPVLVLATTSGHLHHCVVIDAQKQTNPVSDIIVHFTTHYMEYPTKFVVIKLWFVS